MERAGEAQLSFSQLQAIASPTRLRLLQALLPRHATLSELSDLTGVAKATIHSSMALLAQEGFLRRIDLDKMWVYYELTPLGRAVATMKPLRLVGFYSAATLTTTGGAGMIAWDRLRRDELPWNIPPTGVPPDRQPLISLDPTALGIVCVVIGIGATLVLWLRTRGRFARALRQFG